ncbi:MAG: hypothetical protein WCV86_04760 [Patescibacteria group bacterium]|jgi:hypothetical protein
MYQPFRFDVPPYVCIDCGGRYDSQSEAENCPYCNEQLERPPRMHWAFWVFMGMILMGMIVLLFMTVTPRAPHSVLRTTSAPAAPP